MTQSQGAFRGNQRPEEVDAALPWQLWRQHTCLTPGLQTPGEQLCHSLL